MRRRFSSSMLRHLAGRLQLHGVGSGKDAPHDAVGHVGHVGVPGDVGEIRKQKGERTLAVELAHATQALAGLWVAHVAAEAEDGVGRIRHDPAALEDATASSMSRGLMCERSISSRVAT